MKKLLKKSKKLALYIPKKRDKNEPIDIFLPIRSEFDDDEVGTIEYLKALKKYEKDEAYLKSHPKAMSECEFNEFIDDIYESMKMLGIKAKDMQKYIYSISSKKEDDDFRDLVIKSLSDRYQDDFLIDGHEPKKDKQEIFEFPEE